MNLERLQLMADFLQRLPDDAYTLQAYVQFNGTPAEHVEELTDGSRACPIGWLPAVSTDWCWLAITDPATAAVDVVPAYKYSAIWTAQAAVRRSSNHTASCGVWRQAAEWLEMSNAHVMEVLFGKASGLDQRPALAAGRIIKVVERPYVELAASVNEVLRLLQ